MARSLVALVMLALLSGCAGPEAPGRDTQDGPPAAEDQAAEQPLEENDLAGTTQEFGGTYSGMTSVYVAGVLTRSDYFREGDPGVAVRDGAVALHGEAVLTATAPPGAWTFCLTQGDPHDGFCASGQGTLVIDVPQEAIARGDWMVWVFTSEEGPANASAAVEIDWSAAVTYA